MVLKPILELARHNNITWEEEDDVKVTASKNILTKKNEWLRYLFLSSSLVDSPQLLYLTTSSRRDDVSPW